MSSKILVVGPSWIGDMVMAQSLFITLKQNHPNCIIDVLAPAWALAVLNRMPEVNTGIALDIEHGSVKLAYRYQLGKKLRAEKYHLAIIIPRSFKSALVPYFANIPKRIGFKGEMRYGLINDIRKLDKAILKQTVQKMVALAKDQAETSTPITPYPKLKTYPDKQQQLLQKFKLDKTKKIIGLMPGAEYGPAKLWPVKYFAKVAKVAYEQGQQVLLFGSDKDQIICKEINQLNDDNLIDLSGKTSIEDVIDLLGLCEKVVCNDSGLMHIAAATDCEIHTIYGSSSPKYTPPLTTKATIYSSTEACSPCFARTCRFAHYNCLLNVTPEKIITNLFE